MSSTAPTPASVSSSAVGRAINGQTAIDFIGHRRYGLGISLALIVIAAVSLSLQGLNLGIDFTGGVSWDVPATNGFTVDDAEEVLAENELTTEGARLQERSSDSTEFVKVQVGDQPAEVVAELRGAFADAAGVDVDDVNVNLVSASWGGEVTDAAVQALVIFTAVVALYLSIRLEWRMAIGAIVAMLHDIVVALGIYSVLQFIVTPPTVIAFLTILGYSLYDTVVVFDRVRENEARFAAQRPPYDVVLNVSMNQVLMRSLNTSISSVVPVLSLLLIGAGLFGQATLAEFALALLIGMIVGAYSSILVAAPILGLLKNLDGPWAEESPVPSSVLATGLTTSEANGRFARFGQRVSSALFDGLLTGAPHLLGLGLVVAGILLSSGLTLVIGVAVQLLGGIALIVAYCTRVATKGQSWGGSLTGTFIVDASSGQVIGPWRVFGRAVARTLSAIPLGLGFFWTLFDPRGQTWHDKIAGTVVVEPSERQLRAERQRSEPATGDALRALVMGSSLATGDDDATSSRESRRDARPAPQRSDREPSAGRQGRQGSAPADDAEQAKKALSHPPRPRKKKRR